jgi:hypothetical protein
VPTQLLNMNSPSPRHTRAVGAVLLSPALQRGLTLCPIHPSPKRKTTPPNGEAALLNQYPELLHLGKNNNQREQCQRLDKRQAEN